MDNEFILMDRIQKIQQIINEYGIDNFYISFSGGKDSTVVSALVDMAFPNNDIPRVYADTGIEYNLIRDFVKELSKEDNRVVMIKPTLPIRQTLEKYGYPFKSKEHSEYLKEYQRMGESSGEYKRYMFPEEKRKSYGCPNKLKYQFSPDFKLKVSRECCHKLKKDPCKKYMKEHNKPFTITGMTAQEGNTRRNLQCLNLNNKKFNPLLPVTKEWEDWFIDKYQIKLCDIYNPPYNFTRTGCKGCPYNLNLQHDLDVLEKYFPNEKKQCELIWKPVYDEYRRIGYRLRKRTLFDEFKEG